MTFNKEIQMNKWYIYKSSMITILMGEKGLIITEKWNQSQFSLFGKSLPNFLFYWDETSVQGGGENI